MCLVRGRVRIEFSTQYKNQQCVYVCVGGRRGRGVVLGRRGVCVVKRQVGVSQHAIRISLKREHVAEILVPRFHLRNSANEPTAGRTHMEWGG